MSNQAKTPKKKEAPPVEPAKQETFQLTDPVADKVELVGDFTNWQESPIALKRGKNGSWSATVPLKPGEHEYRFLVDGQWRDDSSCPLRRSNSFGAENCVRKVAP